MTLHDTTMGGARREFPTTVWSDVVAAMRREPTHGREHLERLVETYWKPIYTYVRRAFRLDVEDAKDLTQSFLGSFLERGAFGRADPGRGSFRVFLKVALRNHHLNERSRGRAARRRARTRSLEDAPEPRAADEAPDRAFDRAWFACLMDLALADLEQALRDEGRGTDLEAFRLYCLDAAEATTYETVARRLGVSSTDVRNGLYRTRQRLRGIVRARIAEYAGGDDVEAELTLALGP